LYVVARRRKLYMASASNRQPFRDDTPMWSKTIAVVVALIFAAFLSSCGDVGRQGPGGAGAQTGIEPHALAASSQVLLKGSLDFDGDGKGDILWRNDNGDVSIWLMNGMAAKSTAVVGNVATAWKIAPVSGDYDGDGKNDILWRNDDGSVAIWLMNGMATASAAVVTTVSADWKIAGTGDFDGDGKSDLLWRNDDGKLAIWLMNGLAAKSTAVVATVSTDWTVAASGDYNGDGKSDILWRNANGDMSIWLMNGMTLASTAVIGTVSTDWKIAPVSADYDGDGKSDILWRNDDGRVAIWLMNGMATASAAVVTTVSTDWKIAPVSVDYDGDGKSDILWRNVDGRVAIWLMNGLAAKSTAVVTTVSTDWKIAGGPAVGAAPTFSQVIVFGDSAVDSGYYRAVANPSRNATYNAYWAAAVANGAGIPTSSPGLVYPQVLASYFGLTANPANQSGGTNYATSGAKNVDVNTSANGGFRAAIPTVTQIANYLAAKGNQADANALYLISSGTNDTGFALGGIGSGPFPSDPTAYLTNSANRLATAIASLKSAGAKHFVVVMQSWASYNQALFSSLASQGVSVIQADTNSVRIAMTNNPGQYGFTSVSNAAGHTACTVPSGITTAWALLCSSNPNAPSTFSSPNADTTNLYADDGHFSTAGQKIVADYVYRLILQNIPGT
jgi:phospholipase/lecithinase/hemolysin/sRNA-binding regulator protein Hfq